MLTVLICATKSQYLKWISLNSSEKSHRVHVKRSRFHMIRSDLHCASEASGSLPGLQHPNSSRAGRSQNTNQARAVQVILHASASESRHLLLSREGRRHWRQQSHSLLLSQVGDFLLWKWKKDLKKESQNVRESQRMSENVRECQVVHLCQSSSRLTYWRL